MLALAALGGWWSQDAFAAAMPGVKNYRPLGRTGLQMSDISMGTGEPPPVSLILRAIDRGINYIDTAPDYGRAEEVVGQALKKTKHRQVIVATKFCLPGPYPNHLPTRARKKDYIRALEGSLRRLQREWVDFVFVHAIGEQSKDIQQERARLFSEEMLSAVEVLKRQGKMRFLAVSSHGPYHMEPLLFEAIRSGYFDLIMTAFNFMKFPQLPEVIKEAHRRGIAVIAMKTLAGAKQMRIRKKDTPFALAALRWVLKHPELSGLVITFRSISQLNLYLRASGTEFTSKDMAILDRYERLLSKSYCRPGCSLCEEYCPEGVSVANIMRYRHYMANYGQRALALEAYRRVEKDGSACVNCKDRPCEMACPFGIEIAGLLSEVHKAAFRV